MIYLFGQEQKVMWIVFYSKFVLEGDRDCYHTPEMEIDLSVCLMNVIYTRREQDDW